MRKNLGDLKLNIERTVIEMPPDTTKLLPFREFVPGVTSAFLDGVSLSESEAEAVSKVIYAAAYCD